MQREIKRDAMHQFTEQTPEEYRDSDLHKGLMDAILKSKVEMGSDGKIHLRYNENDNTDKL